MFGAWCFGKVGIDMVTVTPVQRTLVFSYENESDLRFGRIVPTATNGQLLSFGRAINSLQREQTNTILREERAILTREDSYANS